MYNICGYISLGFCVHRTKAKLEINKEHVYNPIIQDIKKEKLRYYPDPSVVHYGAFPQTWEDPSKKDHVTGNDGDNGKQNVLIMTEQNWPFVFIHSILSICGCLQILWMCLIYLISM